MSQLSQEQLTSVETWAAEGLSLNQIQDCLKSEYGINLTYMEARLLLVEVGVKLKDKPREVEKPAEAPAPPQLAETELPAEVETETWDEPPADGEPGAPGAAQISVSLDQIAIPGAMVSGKVTFTDGQTAAWYLDQMGRLGLGNVPPGYQPPKADIAPFQTELERCLQRAGF
jgi:hypothetical protein